MKTVKTTIIVLLTLFGVFLLIFFGSAIISAINKVNAERNTQANMDVQFSITDKLDSLSKNCKGEKVIIRTEYNSRHGDYFTVPVYKGLDDDLGELAGNVHNGDNAEVLSIEPYSKKVRIVSGSTVGYIPYYYINEYAKIAKLDSSCPKF